METSISNAFVVVAFTSDNTVAVVSYKWLTSNKACRWPSYQSTSKLAKAIHGHQAPAVHGKMGTGKKGTGKMGTGKKGTSEKLGKRAQKEKLFLFVNYFYYYLIYILNYSMFIFCGCLLFKLLEI